MSNVKKFECTNNFYVDKYDADGFWTGKQTIIKKGEVFECDLEDKLRVVGGDDTLRLENDKQWLELTEESIRENFVEVVGNE